VARERRPILAQHRRADRCSAGYTWSAHVRKIPDEAAWQETCAKASSVMVELLGTLQTCELSFSWAEPI
jgi:hypothetical protein